MHKLNVFSNFGFNLDINTKTPCELYVDSIPNQNKETVKVLWMIEPNQISGIKKNILDKYSEFDLILTWDKDILLNCHNSKLFPYGTTWIEDFKFEDKEYCITSLIGGKNGCEGHLFRQFLPEITKSVSVIPIELFNSRNNPSIHFSNTKEMKSNSFKNELFYSQYHISIENVFETNWFTEKLIDCFQTKTVPIYRGCKNIGDYFDTRGMFIFESKEDLINICNNLTPDTYQNMLQYVNNNYSESFKYSNHKKRLEDEINLFLKKC